MTVTPSRDESLLDLIRRDLDGDLSREERHDLFRQLAEREDAHMLLRSAIIGDQAAAALRAACDAAPTPDLSAMILAAVADETDRTAPARPQAKGLWSSLKGALSGDRPLGSERGRGGLDLSDLAGVVAGTGAASNHSDEIDTTAGNDSDSNATQDKAPD